MRRRKGVFSTCLRDKSKIARCRVSIGLKPIGRLHHTQKRKVRACLVKTCSRLAFGPSWRMMSGRKRRK